MTIHRMSLVESAFSKFKEGKKTIELRLFDEKRSRIKLGDRIEFTSLKNGEKLLVEVMALYPFSSFKELYQHLPLEKCGYSKEELSYAKASDMERYYSEEQLKSFGVLGIECRVLEEK